MRSIPMRSAPMRSTSGRGRIARAATLALAALLLGLVLVLPDRPSETPWRTLLHLPLELPALLGLLVVAGAWRPAAWVMRIVVALGLLTLLVLKAADYALFETFARAFNPVTDLFILSAGANLLRGAIGPVLGTGALIAGAIALLLVAGALLWAARRWSRPGPGPALRAGAGIVALTFAALTALDATHLRNPDTARADPPGSGAATIFALRHVESARGAARDLAAYRIAAAEDPFAGRPGLFDRLGGRDVILIFVESYGRTSFDNPLYAATHVPTLRAAETDLAKAGLAARSLWLTSPIEGGQSWLAHGTFSSGLETSDQARYGAMLTSARRTLFHLAHEAGYRTSAVVPAITLPWPEGPMIGFDIVLAAADLGYAGQPFNWITMPDQYTLSAYPALLGDDPRPDFTEIALISSHAPWTPIPPMIPWDEVGDGTVFDEWANSGDPPSVVWQDRDRVRDQYRQGVDYSLRTVMSFAARQAGQDEEAGQDEKAAAAGKAADAPLLIVLGDHQPVPWVAQTGGRDVPLHLIGTAEVLALFDGWDATPGLVPDAISPVWPMQAFRDRFLDAVSPAPGDDRPTGTRTTGTKS